MLRDNSSNLRTTFLIIFPNTLGDLSSPTHWRAALKNHRGSEDSTTSSTLASSSPGVMCEQQSCFRAFPNKDGQPPSAQIVGVSLSGGPIVCFDSGWPELFGDFVARRSVYGAEMLPRTTDFGVTPEEAKALHQKQKASQNAAGIWDGSAPKN
ncbi:mei2-like protein [Fusarium subglutinans]|uniref:Mei2-like protein n=1 Tax=Gibberella subglutinans TaxID=42677 RepID=A0A8H5V7D2_GIBSU|nr:mei2-like protein [Fusarium subglutinans]KAF5611883.1 mei2-like protein [Fusarium subglutinans]